MNKLYSQLTLHYCLENVKKLIDQKQELDELPPDPLGTKEDLTDAVNEEIANELTNAVLQETNNKTNIDIVVKNASQMVAELMDEKEAIDEAENLSLIEKAEIEDKLEDEAFTLLVNSKTSKVHDNLNETDALFVDLAKEEEAIENLDIDPKHKAEIEQKLEDTLLGEVPALEEVEQVIYTPNEPFKHIHQVKEALSTFTEQKEGFTKLNFTKDIKQNLEEDLTNNVLKQVIDAHTNLEDSNVIKNKTNEVLSKLDKAQSYVKDMKEVGIGNNHDDIDNHLEFDALEDIAEVVEGIKDEKEIETEDKVNYINKEKFTNLEEAKDLIREPHNELDEEVNEILLSIRPKQIRLSLLLTNQYSV